jgi:GntR family transcriptional regulator/MocR family aminotransferase
MERDWAGSLDLHVELDAGSGRRVALERAVRTAIRGGRLRPGDRVPSTRALAHDLGLARGTVAEAYAQLAAEGYLHTRPGAPTRVASELRPAELGDAQPAAVTEPAPPRFDLRAGIPDVSAFPRSAWLGALRRGLAAAPDAALADDDPRGLAVLRGALASYLGRARGVVADPERIVVCAGFAQGLALLSHAFGATGVRVLAMEDPCLEQHRAIVAAAGLRVTALTVDEHGARPAPDTGGEAVLLTPAHQFPLGSTLAPARRAAFAAWARANATVAIEDDYDGEFRYDRQPAGALQGLDPEHVVYAGTASKTLAPALRLGWLVLPRRLVEPVVAAKRLAGQTAALDQLALAELLRSGAYDRHVRRMRQRYRRRRDLLLALLAERAPGLRTRGIAAGLHLLLELESERELVARAQERSLAVQPLAPFWHRSDGAPQGVVLGYAAAPEHTYRQTLAALADALTGP